MTNSPLRSLSELLDNPDFGETPLPDGTSVILDIAGHQVVSLSRTGTYIVGLIRAGVQTVDEIAERIAARYEVDNDTAKKDAADFIDTLTATLTSAATHRDT
jgi:hypothetical protein